ncbi:MAG: hypothetical protein ACFB9N_18015 [Geitlerinemataceae cyanobacterium]
MNAIDRAVTPGLASKIARLAVFFRAEFPGSTVDFSPWVPGDETLSQVDPYSIDLSFRLPRGYTALQCQYVLMQVHFSGNLLGPSCTLQEITASGYMYTAQRWEFSTIDRQFEGLAAPKDSAQVQFQELTDRIFELFEHPNRVRVLE